MLGFDAPTLARLRRLVATPQLLVLLRSRWRANFSGATMLFADVLRNPAFDASELERVRGQVLALRDQPYPAFTEDGTLNLVGAIRTCMGSVGAMSAGYAADRYFQEDQKKMVPEGIEAEIVAARQRDMNRYEIHAALQERRDQVPSPSTIYRVLVDQGLNRRTPAMREEKRRIIKDKIGELGHVDLHQLPRDMFLAPPPNTAFVVSLLDSCSRLAWAEVVTSKKALPVMFKTLKMINTLNVSYGVQFAEILSDNGAEFASRRRAITPGAVSALRAAVVPAHSPALYFVARGDGSSEFSPDLTTHNAAVQRYQLKRPSAVSGKAQ